MSGRGKEAPDRTRQRRLGDQAFKEYSEEQLEEIAQSLAGVLRIPAGNKALREVLRRRIQWHAKRYLMGAHLHHAPDSPLRLKLLADRQPTPKQQAAKLRKEIAVTDTAIRVLGNCETLYNKDCEFPDHLRISLRATLDLLKAERPKLQQRHDASAVDDHQEGQRDRCGNSNARQVYTEFWTLLTEAWLAIVPAATTQLYWRKHLGRFLFACSKPVFPEGTTEEALDAFIDRYSRKRQSKVAGV